MVDPAAVRGDAQANIAALGGSAAATNIVTGRQGTQAGFRDLMMGGLAFTDPAAARAIQQFTAQNRVSPQDLAEQGRLQAIINSGTNANGKPLTAKQIAAAQAKLTALTTKIDTRQQRVADFTQQTIAGSPSAADAMRQADPSTYANIDRAQGIADQMGGMTDAGRRFMGALGQGYQTEGIQRGALGETLYGRAQQMAGSTGELSPQAARDAVQSARQAFSARGLGTSAGSAAAELLNRDQYSRQRMFQDLSFAQGAQEMEQRRQIANEEARRLGNQMNIGMLGDATNYEQGLQDRGLGASLQMAGVQQQANPLMRALMFDPYGTRGSGTQALGPGTQLAGGVMDANTQIGMFNANANNWAKGFNMYGQYGNQQSGMGSSVGSLAGMGLGAGIGALLAAPTGGMSITTGAMLGAGLGGGAGAGLGGLFGR